MITSPKAIPWDFYNLSNRFNTLKRQNARATVYTKYIEKTLKKLLTIYTF